jgi:phage shock protein A
MEDAIDEHFQRLEHSVADLRQALDEHLDEERKFRKKILKIRKKVLRMMAEREAALVGAHVTKWIAIVGAAALTIWAFIHGSGHDLSK